jgi:hypothetical protein
VNVLIINVNRIPKMQHTVEWNYEEEIEKDAFVQSLTQHKKNVQIGRIRVGPGT